MATAADVKRLTNLPGPDGGAFFSPDGSADRVPRPPRSQAGQGADEYQTLLKEGLWRPTSTRDLRDERRRLERAAGDALGAANFAPFFFPDGKRIIFSSNLRRREAARLRPLRGRRRRHGPRARHASSRLRRLPDVLARRDEARVRVQPEPEDARATRTSSSRAGSPDMERADRATLSLRDLVAINSVNPSLVPGAPARPAIAACLAARLRARRPRRRSRRRSRPGGRTSWACSKGARPGRR